MNPVPVQIENVTLPPKSALNPEAYHATGVCGECTRCHRTATANPADFRGGPKTRRKAAVLAVLADVAKECPHPLPWGSVPVHADRGIPRGVTLWALEKTTGDRLPIAAGERGKLVGVWGGVALDAVVLVVPEGDDCAGTAGDFAAELQTRGYVAARVAKPEPVKGKS